MIEYSRIRHSLLVSAPVINLPTFLNLVLFCSLFIIQSGLDARAGHLAAGPESKVPGEIKVALYPISDLNYKTRSEILGMRRRILTQSPLYSGTYSPNDYVFGQIEDRKPWWGMYGMYVYKSGHQSILGPAKESRYIYNPYMLVAAEPTCVGLIDPTKVDKQILAMPGFPFVWNAQDLIFNPREARASITYDVTGYQKKVTQYKKYLKGDYRIDKFSLIAYNARDLGYEYMYINLEKSSLIENQYIEKNPVELRQMIHCGGSCGYPGGCNNMSPLMAELDFLKFKSLPARITIYLWKEKPYSVSEKPDFTYVINLR